MELRTLRYFLEIAEKGSLSSAAESLHVTQPTLSRQLALLEAQLGQELYSRTHRGITLTPEGVVLQNYAQSIVELTDRATEALTSQGADLEGTIHIGICESRVLASLAGAICEMRRQHPKVQFHLHNGPVFPLREQLVRGNFDFLLLTEYQNISGTSSYVFPEKESWCLLVPEGHPLARKKHVTANDLAKIPLIMPNAFEKLPELMEWLGGDTAGYSIAARYDLPLVGKYLVDNGVGAMLTYTNMPGISLHEARAIPLSPVISGSVAILWRTSSLNRCAKAFRDILCSEKAGDDGIE